MSSSTRSRIARSIHLRQDQSGLASSPRTLGFTPSELRKLTGAIAKSNFAGCRYREPVYRTLRELALSYFNIYFNLRFERTLRRYSRPVNLAQFDRLNWITTDKPLWFIAEHLCEIPHIRLLTPAMERNLTRLDPRSVKAEMTGHRRKMHRSY